MEKAAPTHKWPPPLLTDPAAVSQIQCLSCMTSNFLTLSGHTSTASGANDTVVPRSFTWKIKQVEEDSNEKQNSSQMS